MLTAKSTFVLAMKRLLVVMGFLSCALAATDAIHGPNNGDIHRTYIHVPEFICFLVFLCLLEAFAFRYARNRLRWNSWLVLMPFAVLAGVVNMVLFAASGGGVCGDGGPIAAVFITLSAVAEATAVVSLIGFIVSVVDRKSAGFPILRR